MTRSLPPSPASARGSAKGRGPRWADQAIRCTALGLLLAGCGRYEPLVDLPLIARDAAGTQAERRLPPPGLDRPSPTLSQVPPVPERPDLTARAALTRQLEADRAAAVAAAPPRPPGPAEVVPGNPLIPAAPPPPPALAAAPPVRVGPTPGGTPAGATAPAGEGLAPGAVPALPPPELLAPAPPALAPAPASR